jgi:uncharacterized protein (DUF2267 family)
MDELIEEVVKRTGLNEDQARGATKAVTEYLKDHLPEPASKALAQFLGGTEDEEKARAKKAQIAAVAATTAAVNVVVLPHAH